MAESTAFQNLLVAGILLGFFVLMYCKIRGQTIGDMISELRNAISPPEPA